MNNLDYGALLESNFLSSIRSISVFFVAGIALFNFTDLGKNFSIISLIVALVLLIAIVTDYFIERHRISQLGFYPRTIIDIIAYTFIGILFLIIWVVYTVWNTTQTSLGDLTKEIEKEVTDNNLKLIQNVKDIQEKIVETNRDLIESIRNINNPNYIPKYASDKPVSSHSPKADNLVSLSLDSARERQSGIVTDAMLASVT